VVHIVFDEDAREDWSDVYKAGGPGRRETWKAFREQVLSSITKYVVPVIKLSRETPKEAVCVVFEKVNTGGVPLNVFELLTATFAGDTDYFQQHGPEDWRTIEAALEQHRVLAQLENTDFLQALTLLATRDRRNKYEGQESVGSRAPAISCKRGEILRLSLVDYLRWRDRLVAAFAWCGKFLMQQHIFRAKDLPYHSQLVPLAVLRVILGDRADHHAVSAKLRRWYWSGVLGELYGGTTETRFARDAEQVPAWVDGGDLPETVSAASFHEQRLLTLKSRQSAAYKGVYALLMQGGCEDWLKNQRLDTATFYDLRIDIHHVFPKDWCVKNKIDAQHRESVVNKTPLAYDTNRIIGGKSPAEYVPAIERRSGLEPARLDDLIATHRIAPATLREADFDAYFEARKEALLDLIGNVMGQAPVRAREAPNADLPDSFSELVP
jgi:hypothetical protein